MPSQFNAVEFNDDIDISKFGGFSISYLGPGYSPVEGDADVTVCLEAGKRVGYEFSFPVVEDGYAYEVIVRADGDDIWALQAGMIKLEDLKKEINYLDPKRIRTAVTRFSPKAPYLTVASTVPRQA